MYIEPGTLPKDLLNFMKILTDDETKLTDILDVQESGNGYSSQDSSNEGVEKKTIPWMIMMKLIGSKKLVSVDQFTQKF